MHNQESAERGPSNRLLVCLDEETTRRWEPLLKLTQLESQQVLYRPEERISRIYFPVSAVLCMLTVMEDGHTIESATVGNEGASWISASFSTPSMPCQTMVAVGGAAYAIEARHVEQETQRNSVFHNALSEYSHTLLISSLRTGACNALHTVTQRCARWMLITLDRTVQERFAITQEYLASLLGCNRPALTHILGELERAGGIHSTRGKIEIVNRIKLEQSTCECYRLIRGQFESLRAREARLGDACEASPRMN